MAYYNPKDVPISGILCHALCCPVKKYIQLRNPLQMMPYQGWITILMSTKVKYSVISNILVRVVGRHWMSKLLSEPQGNNYLLNQMSLK